MKNILEKRFGELEQVLKETLLQRGDSIEKAATLIVEAYRNDRGLFLMGNGGSAADAQHVAG